MCGKFTRAQLAHQIFNFSCLLFLHMGKYWFRNALYDFFLDENIFEEGKKSSGSRRRRWVKFGSTLALLEAKKLEF
jgi:hypothetical protein